MDSLLKIPLPFPTSNEHEENQLKDEPMENCSKDDGDIQTNNEDLDRLTETNDESSSNSDTIEKVKLNLEVALRLKEEATESLKNNNIDTACQKYKEALKNLKCNLDETNFESEKNVLQEIKSTKIAINSNLALCYIKLQQWIDAIHACLTVLKEDNQNIKALYRCGLARSRIGLFEEARDDLLKAHQFDSKNIDIRRELLNVKNLIIESKKKDKESFGAIFSKVEGLYSDCDRLVEEKKKQEQEKLKQDMKQFEMINKQLESEGKTPFSSYDEWKKSEESKKNNIESKPAITSKSITNKLTKTFSDSIELDEEDQQIVKETSKMGYCYFNRPQVKETFENNKSTPIKISQEENIIQENKKSLSSWNSAGTTYEELDCSTWFIKKFEKFIIQCQSESSSSNIHVTSVDDITGEAQIVVLRSSKRYLYDINCRIEWVVNFKEDSKYKHLIEDNEISGSLYISDISSTTSKMSLNNESMPDWLINAKPRWDKTKYPEIVNTLVEESINHLIQNIYIKVDELNKVFQEYA